MTDTPFHQTVIDTLFTGTVQHLPEGSESAIYKNPVDGPAQLDVQGLVHDEQADHTNHAGPERALHHYPAEHHDHWREQFDDPAFGPGLFGENLSTRGVLESQVHVGDVFRLGTATIELAQPRQPCWKPGTRTGHKTMARELVGQGRAGWFYRVLEPGTIQAGDILERIETADHGISLAEFWRLANARQPDDADRKALRFLIDLPALAEEWRPRLERRLG